MKFKRFWLLCFVLMWIGSPLYAQSIEDELNGKNTGTTGTTAPKNASNTGQKVYIKNFGRAVATNTPGYRWTITKKEANSMLLLRRPVGSLLSISLIFPTSTSIKCEKALPKAMSTYGGQYLRAPSFLPSTGWDKRVLKTRRVTKKGRNYTTYWMCGKMKHNWKGFLAIVSIMDSVPNHQAEVNAVRPFLASMTEGTQAKKPPIRRQKTRSTSNNGYNYYLPLDITQALFTLSSTSFDNAPVETESTFRLGFKLDLITSSSDFISIATGALLDLGIGGGLSLHLDAAAMLGLSLNFDDVKIFALGQLGLDWISEVEDEPRVSMPFKPYLGPRAGLWLSPLDDVAITITGSMLWRYESIREIRADAIVTLYDDDSDDREGISFGAFYTQYGKFASTIGGGIGFGY